MKLLAANAAGGGTVVIPAGKYESGPIEMVSNLTLHFPAQGPPFTEGRQQSVEALAPVPLIGGRHLENGRSGQRQRAELAAAARITGDQDARAA